jgi:hypothetical protein
MSPLLLFVCDLLLSSWFLLSLAAIVYTWLLFSEEIYRRKKHLWRCSGSILVCSLLTYMIFRLACFMFLLVTGGNIEDQFVKVDHWVHGWFCFGLENYGLEFSSCFCKILNSDGSCIFGDLFLRLIFSFIQFFLLFSSFIFLYISLFTSTLFCLFFFLNS